MTRVTANKGTVRRSSKNNNPQYNIYTNLGELLLLLKKKKQQQTDSQK